MLTASHPISGWGREQISSCYIQAFHLACNEYVNVTTLGEVSTFILQPPCTLMQKRPSQGRIQDLHLKGGCKRLCERRHVMSANLFMLSEPWFKHSDTNLDLKIKHKVDPTPLSNWPKNTERPPEDVPCAPQTTVSLKGRGVKSSG